MVFASLQKKTSSYLEIKELWPEIWIWSLRQISDFVQAHLYANQDFFWILRTDYFRQIKISAMTEKIAF